MDKHYVYDTKGKVCSREIRFDIIDGRVRNIEFEGGCRGNTQGVANLAEGMLVEDVIKRCKHVICHDGTSCPDQLAKAIEECIK